MGNEDACSSSCKVSKMTKYSKCTKRKLAVLQHYTLLAKLEEKGMKFCSTAWKRSSMKVQKEHKIAKI